jgi:hypothetical protein
MEEPPGKAGEAEEDLRLLTLAVAGTFFAFAAGCLVLAWWLVPGDDDSLVSMLVNLPRAAAVGLLLGIGTTAAGMGWRTLASRHSREEPRTPQDS